MDDMISRLSEILDNPEQAEKIKQIAASMMNGSSESINISEPNEPEKSTVPVSRSYEKLFTTVNYSRNANLLNAIKPYMRSSRADKIGSALKALEMIDLLSKLK